jgi:toxin YoeB
MKKVQFTQIALDDLKSFKTGNQKLIFKILELIEDIQKNPFEGLGKPEPLKHEYAGYWSRRINEEHRLVYKISDEAIEIYRCSGHYTRG